jgi:P-type Cu+ transporter
MYVVVDGAIAGLLGVADPVKQSTPEAIGLLHEDGISAHHLAKGLASTIQS